MRCTTFSRARSQVGRDLEHGPAAGRDRHRQGARRPRDPQPQPAQRSARSSGSTAPRCRRRSSRASSSATRRAPSPARCAQRKGRFETADGSTLFLDEIGELPLDLQAKLLRVLQEGEFERVGGNRTLQVDVRLIAATNRDARGRGPRRATSARTSTTGSTSSRSRVPPLRERREDMPLLARHFVEKVCRRLGPPAARAQPRDPRGPRGLRLARQRARARERHRAGGDHLARTRPAPRRDAARRASRRAEAPAEGAGGDGNARAGRARATSASTLDAPRLARRGRRRRRGRARDQRQHPAQPDAQARNPATGSIDWRRTRPPFCQYRCIDMGSVQILR